MIEREYSLLATLALAFSLVFVLCVQAQKPAEAPIVYHKIDGRLRIQNRAGANIRVRLVREDQRRPIGETFSRSGGEFEFPFVPEGQYLIETLEAPELEATSTLVVVRPLPRDRPGSVHVEIDIPEKPPSSARSGVVAADVDLNVPKQALSHYRNGIKALEVGETQRALNEFQHALRIFPDYYAARLELGRQLRLEKRFREAEEALGPLTRIAAKHAEAWIEHAIVLLELQRPQDAAKELRVAVQREETNWAAHYYLAWALLEGQADEAEPHFNRAIELNEEKAARAHLALARLADGKGQRQLAIKHLDAYLALAPSASDAEMARQLADRLRKSNP